MQHNFLTTMRSLKLIDGCKGSQVYALNHNEKPGMDPHCPNPAKIDSNIQSHPLAHTDTFLPYGLPSSEFIEPPIEPHLKFIDFIETLAELYHSLEECTEAEKSGIFLHLCTVFKCLSDPKLQRRSLRSVRQHAIEVHDKAVTSAWLRFERREDELDGYSPLSCPGQTLECPKAALIQGYDPNSVYHPCPCRTSKEVAPMDEECSTSSPIDDSELAFCIGDEEVVCIRHKIAALSKPLHTMLYGCFTEAWREKINFSKNDISVEGMKAVEEYSRTGKVEDFAPNVILELLSFANKFCCERMKSVCDAYLASIISSLDDAIILVEYGLEENAYLLVASCLQIFLRELPKSLYNSSVTKLFCSIEGRERLASVGHASFLLYYFLSQVAMEEDMKSNTTVMLLERLGESATTAWQKQLALHQLGCTMLERGEYKDAQNWFEAAAKVGHIYSLAGVARAKYKRGHKYSAYKQMNSLISDYKPAGWMYQERSLYCIGKEKVMDLTAATELDPSLSYPYKYRAIAMMEDKKIGAAISEINKILGFKVSADCLELRAWFSLATEDYEGALKDIRAMLTLDPNHMMFHGKLHGDQMVDRLQKHVQQWNLADCWMQLYDRWSAVDDIGSLAVVHQMLANEPGKSLLWFRQSLLLLRLNCLKAAMRSLRLARNHATCEHERLVYEGWILYDTGHREEALVKAEESIAIQRSFEAYFLKAYALADANLDEGTSAKVIELLEAALKCPSDGLRKGQAFNNLGSIYVECNKPDLAADCYLKALDIRHTRAHQGLARVYSSKRQKKAAYDEMTKMIEKARNNASAYEKRSEYSDDPDMTRSDLMMATRLDPLRTYPYRYRAAVLMDDQREAEAIAEVTRPMAFKPEFQLLHLRAQFHESMGDIASTLRDSSAALCFDPSNAEVLEMYKRAQEKESQAKK
ncbi:ethylene-overproduction protein 1-like [Aristolochia californica]|uniref:ethylene-overproduction protein 1-like n=1 Tax=Aristolochia californica TaxID=171875 RepID=UPI0035E11004